MASSFENNQWTVSAAPAASVAARRLAASVVGVAGFALAVLAGIGAGAFFERARGPIAPAIALAAGVVWLVGRMWRAPPGSMASTIVSVPRPGVLVLRGREHFVRSCFYDGATDVLWARGHAAIPIACVKAPRDVACEVVDALGCTERGLRTLGAMPAVFAVPLIGGLLALAIGCALSFGVVMLLAGPPHIGLPAAAITIPLAVFAFGPARVELREAALAWRWWSFTREIPLSSIARVTAQAGTLRVETADGQTRKLRVDMVAGGWLASTNEPRRVRLAAFADFVERRAVATTFE